MKYLSKFLKLSCYAYLATACLLLSSPMKAWAEANECSEALLRNLSVAMVNCKGDPAQCTTPTAGPISMTASANIPEPHKAVIERAASQHSVNPNLIAALFLTEQGNIWKPFAGPYATSHAGASGPFQFMPGTWAAYKSDGNGDGKMDVQNFEDAAFAASKLAATGTNQSTPLGDLARPFAPGTLIYFSATYNWGGGNVSKKTNPDSPITAGPKETQNYMRNIHALISSDFTKSGHTGYGPPRQPGQPGPSGSASPTDSAAPAAGGACVSDGSATSLVTNDPGQARTIILSSDKMVWGNYGSATTQKEDVKNCLTNNTLFAIATMAERANVKIPVNALATDHGGCSGSGGSFHNSGQAIDIGYYGNNAAGAGRHIADGDTMYKFLFDNREVLKINELIWQYPPDGYKCVNNGKPGDCDVIYSAATMNQHYHHIHVGFN